MNDPLERHLNRDERHLSRGSSWSSTDSQESGAILSHRESLAHGTPSGDLPPPILVYHASARSIVFRDQLRRAAGSSSNGEVEDSSSVGAPLGSSHDGEPSNNATVPTIGNGIVAGVEHQNASFSHFDSPSAAETLPRNAVSEADLVIRQQKQQEQEQGQSPPQPRHVVLTDDAEGGTKQVDRFGTIGLIAQELLLGDDSVAPSMADLPGDAIAGYHAVTQPLEPLQLGPNDEFASLLQQPTFGLEDDSGDILHTIRNVIERNNLEWTEAEQEVVYLLATQHACVKTIKNVDWSAFVDRFLYAHSSSSSSSPQPILAKTAAAPSGVTAAQLNRRPATLHEDIPADENHHFNAFVTSTSMLPSYGRKMRCYGSTTQYTVGVVFALPEFASREEEEQEVERTHTWSWPSGYSAKTEFNRDSRGRLINGRQEALRSIGTLREYNHDYLHGTEYVIGQRKVDGSTLSQIPYNEVFVRVGGLGRVVGGRDVASGEPAAARSLARGVGLPVALFCRAATFGSLISLLRTRARLAHVLGKAHMKEIPLLYITPEDGVRVLTERLQTELWKIASQSLTPFQNSTIAYRTTISHTDDASFQQKVDELLDLDDSIRQLLTPEELARIAGGFGATDESVASVLRDVLSHDREINKKYNNEKESESSSISKEGNTSKHRKQHSCRLQDVVNEGLASAVRSGDYHTSRQLLILYSLVASAPEEESESDDHNSSKNEENEAPNAEPGETKSDKAEDPSGKPNFMHRKTTGSSMGHDLVAKRSTDVSTNVFSPLPPPPPLDTDRLRSATNSDGLLSVLGAAQVLRAIQEGTARRRVQEAIDAVEEWVNYGEQSMAFRISSWYDQRAAQGDLKIATDRDSQFMAFVSNKAISNRKAFAQQLRDAVSSSDFNDFRFLQAINEMLKRMHSPCLRLELLQYVLGLDNRYSVAHVARSVELAATCLSISGSP